MREDQGIMIVLEGIEGAGKTTAAKVLTETLENAGHTVRHTREPGGTPMAEEIRHTLLKKREEPVDPMTEVLLFFAGRRQHLVNLILPALAQGHVVICERFTSATLAYQQAAKGVDSKKGDDVFNVVSEFETLVQRGFRPEMTIILDLSYRDGMQGIRNERELDRFETENESFFERVRQSYLDQAKRWSHRYRVIDATQSKEAVVNDLKLILADLGLLAV